MTRTPPEPPQALLAGLGPGDFWQTGERLVELIRAHAHLRDDDRVLDVGCGLGRVAWPLSRELTRGTYDGIDTVREYVDWCRDALALDRERFRFHHADIANSHYNPNGALAAESLRFPFDEGAFTLAIATSLFTHLSAAATVNYVNEIARVLAPGGRVFASFFVLDEDSREAVATGPTSPAFTVPFAEGMLSDPENPDFAIAFDVYWLHDRFREAGFEIEAYAPGVWRRIGGLTHQDLVVARTRPLQ